MKVNFVEGKIEMTPAFAEAAGKIGSAEYKQLIEVQKNFPTYEIKIVLPKKVSNKFKGLNLAYMEKFIRAHDDAGKTNLKEFAKLRGMKVEVSEDGKSYNLVEDTSKAIKAVASMGEMKQWFLETYHEDFENYDKEVKEIMRKTKEAKAARLAS